jgi:hypothetical protein
MITYDALIKIRRDTATNLTSTNAVYAVGEPVFESDTGKLKIGDGVTAWTSLSYFSGSSGTSLRIGDVTESGGACTLDSKEVVRISTVTTAIKTGDVYTVTLTSNLITASSGFVGTVANLTNSTGYPIIQSITRSGGTAVIKILNVGGQASSDDTNGSLLTILILN